MGSKFTNQKIGWIQVKISWRWWSTIPLNHHDIIMLLDWMVLGPGVFDRPRLSGKRFGVAWGVQLAETGVHHSCRNGGYTGKLGENLRGPNGWNVGYLVYPVEIPQLQYGKIIYKWAIFGNVKKTYSIPCFCSCSQDGRHHSCERPGAPPDVWGC